MDRPLRRSYAAVLFICCKFVKNTAVHRVWAAVWNVLDPYSSVMEMISILQRWQPACRERLRSDRK